MKIGIICPSEDELKPYLDDFDFTKVEKKAMLRFYLGKYINIDLVAVFSGVCKVNAAIATEILIDRYNVDALIVSGVAGGINKKIKIFDTVISTEVAYHDVAEDILTEYHPYIEDIYFKADPRLLNICRSINKENRFINNVFFGRIATGESFITNKGRNEIIKKLSPLCVDMETASVAHVCYVFNIPYIAIRTISDTEEKAGVENFDMNCEKASNNSFLVVKEILKSMK